MGITLCTYAWIQFLLPLLLFYCCHRMSRWPWLNTFHVYLTAHLGAEISLICVVFFWWPVWIEFSESRRFSVFKILRYCLWNWLRWLVHIHIHTRFCSQSRYHRLYRALLSEPSGWTHTETIQQNHLKSLYSVCVYLSVCSSCSARLHAWQQEPNITVVSVLYTPSTPK
jgi:hypothetical protein